MKVGTVNAVLVPRETGKAITAEICLKSNKRMDGLQASDIDFRVPYPPAYLKSMSEA